MIKSLSGTFTPTEVFVLNKTKTSLFGVFSVKSQLRIFEENQIMNLETRKLDVISFLISLKDEMMLTKIEKVINNDSNSSYPFGEEELIRRALKSEDDFANQRVISQEEVERISGKW